MRQPFEGDNVSSISLTPEIGTVDEGFSYLESFTNLERIKRPREYRLDRMRFLLARFGNPELGTSELKPRYIHIAGSKGKGSTATLIASVLDGAGIRTGLYLSPHVTSYRERISLAGRVLPDELYLRLICSIRDEIGRIAVENPDPDVLPTTFELLTLLGFLAFRELRCEWVVLEVGIGGRLDATNVIQPAACVITPIELEHTDWLGTTIPQIAREKAGIVKEGAPVFCGPQSEEAATVIAATTSDRSGKLHVLADHLRVLDAQPSLRGMGLRLEYTDGFSLATRMRLIGSMQAENAALAGLVVHTLFPAFTRESIEKGLARAFLPGRMEMVPGRPPVLLDGAHTPSSTMRLRDTCRELFGDRTRVLIFGSVEGKNHPIMAEILAPHFDWIVVTTPGFFKASNPKQVSEAFAAISDGVELHPDPAAALRRAVELSGTPAENSDIPIVVTGSFYLVAEIRKLLLGPAMAEVEHGVIR